ncbi:MAG: hypothetical protein DYG98_22295 [Haliscomenobacteraceae bacterium CHB4]|nr:hypothetical protein [Saprospiraceae bacterium]MCE7925791.1 hypothetical protein [Haliscomenobacteraceae bacterium CHB4]
MEKLPPLNKEERLYDIVQKGVGLLAEKQEYGQINLVNKLKILNLAVSPASLSNIVKGKKAGLQVLKTAAQGIEAILRSELGMEYARETREFRPFAEPDWQPYIIPEILMPAQNDSGLILHTDGRLSIQQKTEFIAAAQKEVIEVGVRLKTFADYFISRKEPEYKDHIAALLRRGVAVKGYLLDPDSNEASLYFADRARAQEPERDAIAETKKAVEKLKRLVGEFAQRNYPGTFEIFLYKHIPYNHFLVTDRHQDGGRMMVSHYIYGIRRAECPVLEFTRSQQPALFKKYADSLEYFIRDAKPLL